MAVKRQTTRKIFTPKAQGPQSFIEFKVPDWGETQDVVKDVRATGRQYLKKDREVEEIEASLVNRMWDLAQEKFVAWNWVDDDGDPLTPLPQLEKNVLLNNETEAVMEAVQELYRIIDVEQEKKG